MVTESRGSDAELAIFTNFLLIFAKNLAHLAKLLVKNGKYSPILLTNFLTRELAIFAKNIAQGKNVTQNFGNRWESSNMQATV